MRRWCICLFALPWSQTRGRPIDACGQLITNLPVTRDRGRRHLHTAQVWLNGNELNVVVRVACIWIRLQESMVVVYGWQCHVSQRISINRTIYRRDVTFVDVYGTFWRWDKTLGMLQACNSCSNWSSVTWNRKVGKRVLLSDEYMPRGVYIFRLRKTTTSHCEVNCRNCSLVGQCIELSLT